MITNNHNLVAFAKTKIGTPYVYGCKGAILTETVYNYLKASYGDYVWDSDREKIGKVCVDCSGLISWCTGKVRSANQYQALAKEVHPIKDIDKAPIGAAVWRKGHIGIYIGNGEIIEARGSKYGVVKTKVSERNFTHWFLIYDVTYIKETPKPKESRSFPSLKDKLKLFKN